MTTELQSGQFADSAVSSLLRSHAIKPTAQRMEIARILLQHNRHVSADQVLGMVNASATRVSKATVYNTLGLFARNGIVREVIVDPSKVFYDPNTTQHHHFYNVDTSILTDIARDEIELGTLPELPEGTEVDGVDVIVRVKNV